MQTKSMRKAKNEARNNDTDSDSEEKIPLYLAIVLRDSENSVPKMISQGIEML